MTHITLEGVRVHNLRGIDLQIPHNAVTVVCGISGSGKSSLAFDTLFAEGQRRYVETFSPQARLYLDQLERPDVDRLEGIPPAIAVRQQRRLSSPLSTVGSRTELLRYLQLLFAQAGTMHCPQCMTPVQSWTPDGVALQLTQTDDAARALIAFPLPSQSDVEELIAQGFTRGITGNRTVRLEQLTPDDDTTELLIVADRIRTDEASRQRIAEAVRQAFEQQLTCTVIRESEDGDLLLDDRRWQTTVFTRSQRCDRCDIDCPPLSQELLSFHSAVGACRACQGTGDDPAAAGMTCPACDGASLNEFGRSVRLHDGSLPDLLQRECTTIEPWLMAVRKSLTESRQQALGTVFRQLTARLQVLRETGLGYLSLNRPLMTLSAGEARRVMLTAVLGSGLINTLYVLDEPASGLHSTDIHRIIAVIRQLQESGNTVVVVEHDLRIIRSADHVIELGPNAGRDGGTLVFEGSPDQLSKADTHTGQALRESSGESNARSLRAQSTAEPAATTADHWLRLRRIESNNIHGASVDLPLQSLCAVTGVSGSGKSSLIVDALHPQLQRDLGIDADRPGNQCEITDGVQHLSDVLLLEQNPLQRSSRSIPATYLGAFDPIRRLLAETHEAGKRRFTAGTFSFNSARGGRCERCRGHGLITIDMQFLADVETTCDNCHGRRFRSDVLEIRYRDRSVDEILNMTADEAFTFFNGHPRIQKPLASLTRIGLGYLTLGQPLSTLSGGEAQRLRIAALLAGLRTTDSSGRRSDSGSETREAGSLLLLDEPSNGLHAHDSERLMTCLRQLVQVGHSVVIIEHDQSLVEQCDYRITMGPGAGLDGGRILQADWI